MEQELTRSMLYFLKLGSETLEQLLKETKPDSNDLNDTLEYDRRITQLKEIKKLIKQIENGK
jgi:hypothetical protein